jgi:mannose-6-phosphate isomerase-like protein (cupin superfamily)
MTNANRYVIVDFNEIAPVACPCGDARRAFLDVDVFPGTIHRTTIHGTAKTHYHNRLTETYYILDCQPGSALELDGQSVPVRPGMCVVIPPGVRHRAVGHMTLLIVVLPKFDPSDETIVDA